MYLYYCTHALHRTHIHHGICCTHFACIALHYFFIRLQHRPDSPKLYCPDSATVLCTACLNSCTRTVQVRVPGPVGHSCEIWKLRVATLPGEIDPGLSVFARVFATPGKAEHFIRLSIRLCVNLTVSFLPLLG